jgi:phospholipid/cholesterol/gamma-HCH transport system ATP-binding protein
VERKDRQMSLDPSAVPSAAIEFRDVSIGFDGRLVLDRISFSVGQGEMICVTGDSQSGKSVLLRLAIGFLTPDEGDVLIDGQSLTHRTEPELLALRRQRMGMVFQENALFTGKTVFENAAYRLVDQGWPEEKIEEAVLEVLTYVGLQTDLEKPAEELSGGMKRRLEFARALIGWPSIMLFDEPTSGLDPINARSVLDLVLRARDLRQVSSLFVTKSMHEIPYLAYHRARRLVEGQVLIEEVNPSSSQADQVAMRVLVLDAGRVAFLGSSTAFLGSDAAAVRHLLHPISQEQHQHFECDDPWQQNRKGRDGTFE